MEQGSPGKRLLGSSDKGKELHNEPSLTDALNDENPRIGETSEIQTQNLESLTAFQSQQTRHIGTSFSGAPLTGDQLLAQFQGTNEELSAMYMTGNLYSHDQQLFQTNSDNVTNVTVPHNAWYNDVMNFYNLPLPNFPTEFPSSSILQGENIGSSQTQEVPVRSSIVHPSVNVNKTCSTPQAQKNLMMPEPSVPSRSMRIQDNIPNPVNAQSGFDVASGGSSYAKGSDLSGQKRKMVWQDDMRTPSYRSWNPSLRRYQRDSSSSIDNDGGRYTLYDKRYEAIGVPVDPHLRIFNATNGNGNGESSKKAD